MFCNDKGKKSSLIFLIMLLFLSIFFTYNLLVNIKDYYINDYLILLFSFFVSSNILIKYIFSNGLFVFDPFFFNSILFFMIFLIQPMMDLITNNFATYGLDPSVGCVKGTIIYLLSYISFYYGYKKHINNDSKKSVLQCLSIKERNNISYISFWLWCVFFACCILYLYVNGYSIIYILTLGQQDSNTVDELFTKMGFLWKCSVSMIVCMMYYLAFGNKKVLKIVLFVFTGTILIINGSRSIILMYILAPIVYYYTSHKRNPQILLLISLMIGIVLMATIMQAARWGIRSGGNIDVDIIINAETLVKPIVSNFQVYKEYFLFVDAVPERMNFLFGEETIFYTLAMLIPRGIWPSKPDAPFREILDIAVGHQAVLNGEAFPNLAEFYIDFGVIGCIVYTFLYGIYVKYISNLGLYGNTNSHGLVLFSVLLPLLFQFTIRGYIPSNIFSLIFAFLPYFIIRIILILLKY